MHILGISCYYHDAAAAILRDGQLVAAAEEERFSRVKHDFGFPKLAIEFCLREAKIDAARPVIAGVIYNRLRLNIPLQVDATIEYALPQHKTELSFGDLKIQSPYNSYLHAGLPPTPIANPGHASLEAAFHPAPTDALYYVYCGNGHHVFAKTLSDHQANVARCLH